MNKRRLLKLADLLEADAKNKKGIQFDYHHWGSVGNREEPLSCGTSACALGLAAISGAFTRAGLGYTTHPWGSLGFTLNGRTIKPMSAAKRVFGLNHQD